MSARLRLRGGLLLVAAAVAVLTAVPLLGLLVPLLARRALSPALLVGVVVASALAATLVGGWLLARAVGRPVERLLEAAGRLAPHDGLPLLGEGSGPPLPRAALAFERIAAALEEERRRLAAKVEELTRAGRALEEAQGSLARSERLATVGRLASGLAHEIGNPLGAVSGYAEIARARLPPGADPDLAEAVARIAEGAARIDRTLRDLLDFARPAPPRLQPLEVERAFASAVRLARVQARFRGVEVVTEVPPGLSVLADEHQLGQVLLNLLLNAGDAMAGTGRVTLSAEADGGAVALSVRDEGPGIPAADLPRLFEPFFTSQEPGEGTGLGLAISHRVVESLGGALTAANAARGAVFTVRLPGTAGGAC